MVQRARIYFTFRTANSSILGPQNDAFFFRNVPFVIFPITLKEGIQIIKLSPFCQENQLQYQDKVLTLNILTVLNNFRVATNFKN